MTGNFVNVGPAVEFREGRGRRVRVEGVDVAVFRVDGRLFAIADGCPHMGASLADGVVVRGRVVCHWHGWTFDLRTGQGDERPWACAAVYEVRVDDGQLWLKPPPEPKRATDDEPEEEWIRDPESYFKSSSTATDREERSGEADEDPDRHEKER